MEAGRIGRAPGETILCEEPSHRLAIVAIAVVVQPALLIKLPPGEAIGRAERGGGPRAAVRREENRGRFYFATSASTSDRRGRPRGRDIELLPRWIARPGSVWVCSAALLWLSTNCR